MKQNAIPNRTFWLMLGWLVVAVPAHAFYDPSLGRWINRDPIEEAGGLNPYQFVGNNVTDLMDSFGEAAGAPGPQQITMPPAFPDNPFQYPPAGTGGTSGGNLPPAFPTINYPKCSKAGAERNRKGPYNVGSCPCTQTPLTCTDYERCEPVGTAGTHGTITRLGWVPHHDCTKCPEGNYSP